MLCSMLKLPCEEAFVEGDKATEATLTLCGAVHAHDFKVTLTRERVETLRESCERWLKQTQDDVTDPYELARSVIHEACAPDRRPSA